MSLFIIYVYILYVYIQYILYSPYIIIYIFTCNIQKSTIFFAIKRKTVLFVVHLCKVFYELKQTQKYITRNKPQSWMTVK